MYWDLTADSDGWMLIGFSAMTADAGMGGFYEFVQWPMAGQRPLLPTLLDGVAHWVDRSASARVAAIGELCDEFA